ncbi:hypothetical protein A0O36_01629 [Piscirickettsiaceae bacterium NZ-RLO1]|nr:hypothetical protein A0O36_01629 [Piscirickettsiaceae bacterium NZ-RLO1]
MSLGLIIAVFVCEESLSLVENWDLLKSDFQLQKVLAAF